MSPVCNNGHRHATFRSACDCNLCRRDNRKPFSKLMKKVRAEGEACLKKGHKQTRAEGAAQ